MVITGAEEELTVYQFAVATGERENKCLITRNIKANHVDNMRQQLCRTSPR
jgi:hypothetical protein